ncbi:hypothetical protein ABIC86_001754 [Paenibacillus sp. DS2363]|uniref:hypothetical protein n=1 Tax=Paenibacillus TaxID=44249 RepID=UPI00096E52F2|nr:hypothetical protein [Paenibacillus amylolyticus]OME99859.1 hypothetical protein BK124_09905 [Paenibacillus amylolyticus]
MTTNVKDQVEKQEQEAKKEELKTCFIVMPISNADGYDTGHFNRVYDYIIKPACAAAGFKPSRADDTKHTNTIILDILDQIVKADMVLCDLSSKNPNVMYELGIRQAFNLPVVLIKDNATPRVFDTSALRDIEYDQTLRIDNVNSVVDRLTEALKETYRMKDDDTHSLISMLNIEPATLPEKKEISADTAILLDAINTMKSELSLRNARPVERLTWGLLENNESTEKVVSIGGDLVSKNIKLKLPTTFGSSE